MLGIFTRGAKNRARQRRYNNAKKTFKQVKKEKRKQYKYDKETLKITKRNTFANLDYQDASRQQEYNYAVARDKYQYGREVEAYKRSVDEAIVNVNFADLAYTQANLQQDRFKFEQELALDLQEQNVALDYKFAAAGLGLKKREAKASAVSELRKTGIAGLKAAGEVAARGQAGRTAYKNQQAILAETAAVENEIVNNLMDANLGIDLNLRELSDQLIFDKTALSLSRTSLEGSDKAKRMEFERDKLQAYLEAQQRIELRPEMYPAIPEPLALPRPEFQKVFKPNFKIGKPNISDFGQKVGLGQTLLSDGLKIGAAVLTGVTAGAGAIGAANTATAAGSGYATKVGITAGLGSFLSN